MCQNKNSKHAVVYCCSMCGKAQKSQRCSAMSRAQKWKRNWQRCGWYVFGPRTPRKAVPVHMTAERCRPSKAHERVKRAADLRAPQGHGHLFLTSASRRPKRGASTVTTNAPYPAASASCVHGSLLGSCATAVPSPGLRKLKQVGCMRARRVPPHLHQATHKITVPQDVQLKVHL
jgi:hypothetical protein